jgi:hypothetical protein
MKINTPKHYLVYWYQKSATIKRAGLFNCRSDLEQQKGKLVRRGAIVEGSEGYFAAECEVKDFAANIVSFKPTAECEWHGFTLRCMAHRLAQRLVARGATKKELRGCHCIVAELSSDARAKAIQRGLTVVVSGDRSLVNLEVATYAAQGNSSPRRATLVS